MLTKMSVRTAMGDSSVGNIGNCESLVCDVNGFQDNMCVIIHCRSDCFLTVVLSPLSQS